MSLEKLQSVVELLQMADVLVKLPDHPKAQIVTVHECTISTNDGMEAIRLIHETNCRVVSIEPGSETQGGLLITFR